MCCSDLFTFPLSVYAGAEEYIEYIIFVRGDDDFPYRHPNAFRDIGSKRIAEISPKYDKKKLFIIFFGGGEIAIDIIDSLRHDTCPID